MRNEERIARLAEALRGLTDGQIYWIESIVRELKRPAAYCLLREDFFQRPMLCDFGDAVRIHHCFSSEPFTKDKLEYTLETVFRLHKVEAFRPERTHPGHDITIGGTRYSLKTQANKDISPQFVHISKFMELGMGWGNRLEDLAGLRDLFLEHLTRYDRILILRNLERSPWFYELLEIPKEVLVSARDGQFEFGRSSLMPPSAYCYVPNKNNPAFRLYFDGGGEQKLQIQLLKKSFCHMHASLRFEVGQPRSQLEKET